MKDCVKLSDIVASPVRRAMTGFEELDFMYGYSVFRNGTYWGMPEGKISLWAGVSGIGKSRLAIEIAKLCSLNSNVLYFQTESDLEDFAGWAKNTSGYDNFYCSGENSLNGIVETIRQHRPNLVIIDSVNEIEEFSSGTKQESRRLINGDDNNTGLKEIANEIGCHIILLGQLNGDGTIKGGTSLPHLVDIAFDLKPYTKDSKSVFTVSIGIKHRYGRRDSNIYGVWMHEENGVKNVSNSRFRDIKWCESHGLKVKTREEQLCG
jgi:predicted ATP-dependent serine protease